MAGKRAKAAPEAPTLTEATDAYIEERSNTLSPLTIRGYRTVQKHRFQTTMPRRLDQIDAEEWQGIVNMEAVLCAPKTLKTAFAFVRGVVEHTTGRKLPKVSLAAPVPKERPFLTPDEIRDICLRCQGYPLCRSGAVGSLLLADFRDPGPPVGGHSGKSQVYSGTRRCGAQCG